MQVPQHVLVVKLGALGDLFLALESFQSIRAHHPRSHITLLTRPPYVELGRQMPWFNEVWTDSSPKLWQVPRWWRLRRRFRDGAFTRVYDLQGNDRARFYRRLGGWRDGAEWVGAALTQKAAAQAGLAAMPVAEIHRERLAIAGVPSRGPAELSWLDASIATLSLPERFALLIPGCAPSRLYKRWPPERYAELGKLLLSQGVTPVVIGTQADEAAVSAVCAALPEAVNLCGRTNLAQLAALARRAAGVVGNDTGPVHLSAMVGAPTLVLMSAASDPARMKPPGPAVTCLHVSRLADLPAAEVREALRLRTPQPI
jgi:ADP-heptose:LPS heptosyltransferase